MLNIDSKYYSDDLRPVTKSEQTWSAYNMTMLWVVMSISVPLIALSSISFAYGLSPWQTVINVLLGNLLVLIPVLLNSHVGTKFGLSFPLFARATFGLKGAHFPGVLRAISACGWLAVQGWVGAAALGTIIGVIFPGLSGDNWIINLPAWDGFHQVYGSQFVGFILFLILAGTIAFRGQNFIRKMDRVTGPMLIIMVILLIVGSYLLLRDELNFFEVMALGYDEKMVVASGGLVKCFFVTLMTSISYWSTMAISIPDYSRYAKSQGSQIWGQIIGLLGAMGLCTFAGVYFAQATRIKYGTSISDPTSVLYAMDSKLVVIVAALAVTAAAVSTCTTTDIVASSNVIANLWPKKLSYKKGVVITILVAFFLTQAWWIEDLGATFYSAINCIGIILAPIVSISIGDYWIVHRQKVNLDLLYRGKAYNAKAFIAWIVAFLLPLIGMDMNLSVAFLDFVNKINYFWSFFIGFFVYLFLAHLEK